MHFECAQRLTPMTSSSMIASVHTSVLLLLMVELAVDKHDNRNSERKAGKECIRSVQLKLYSTKQRTPQTPSTHAIHKIFDVIKCESIKHEPEPMYQNIELKNGHNKPILHQPPCSLMLAFYNEDWSVPYKYYTVQPKLDFYEDWYSGIQA